MDLSRRILLFGGGAGYLLGDEGGPITARQVVERIQKNVGVPWRAQTVDTFKAGNPDARVKGIATSFSGAFEVLKQASAAGRNFVVVHEPTFYSHEDNTKDLSGDVYEAKQAFIRNNDMVVWRFHDHWHARRPDGILSGMVEALDWKQFQNVDNPHRFVFPTASLIDFSRGIRDKLRIHAMRVVGDPKMPVTNVAFNPGYANGAGVIRALERPDVDALVIGECREWEGVEFARDCMAAGKKKALVVLGHVPSEQSGMKECARWLKSFISEVPIDYMPRGEPLWVP